MRLGHIQDVTKLNGFRYFGSYRKVKIAYFLLQTNLLLDIEEQPASQMHLCSLYCVYQIPKRKSQLKNK